MKTIEIIDQPDGVIAKITTEIFHSDTEINDYVLYGRRGVEAFGLSDEDGAYLVARHKESRLYRYFSMRNGIFYDIPVESDCFDTHVTNGHWSEVKVKIETVKKYTIIKDE